MKSLNEIKNYPAGELPFFEDCAIEIIKCRQVLKWTYVVSYFAEKELDQSKFKLFTYQRTELEAACEQTHELLEEDMAKFLDTN